MENKLKIYKISQTENTGYDTYDSCIVCAESEKEAQNMHPSSDTEWGHTWTSWCSSPDKVTVEYIGEADPKIQKGIILSSFNAG